MQYLRVTTLHRYINGAVKLLRRCPSLSTLVSEFLCTNAYLFRCTSKAPSKVCSGVRITPPRCTPAASQVPSFGVYSAQEPSHTPIGLYGTYRTRFF